MVHIWKYCIKGSLFDKLQIIKNNRMYATKFPCTTYREFNVFSEKRNRKMPRSSIAEVNIMNSLVSQTILYVIIYTINFK